MGVSCDDIGEGEGVRSNCDDSEGSLKEVPGTGNPAIDNDSGDGGLSGGAVAGIVITVLIVLAIVAVLVMRLKKKPKLVPTGNGEIGVEQAL